MVSGGWGGDLWLLRALSGQGFWGLLGLWIVNGQIIGYNVCRNDLDGSI